MHDDENDKGYQKWFSSNDDISDLKAANITQMNSVIESKKKEARELVLHKDYSPLGSNSNYGLTRETPESYGSDIFSKFQFEDLKKAHSETVIPVSEEDLLNRPHYSNVMEMKQARSENIKPMGNNDVKLFLMQQEEKNMHIGSNTAFRLAKQSQEANTINNNISRHFNRILN